jgi:hypothetical protein
MRVILIFFALISCRIPFVRRSMWWVFKFEPNFFSLSLMKCFVQYFSLKVLSSAVSFSWSHWFSEEQIQDKDPRFHLSVTWSRSLHESIWPVGWAWPQ